MGSKCWSKKEILYLIEHYRKYPELWDPANVDYKNRLRKKSAFLSLATAFDTTETEITRKIHNLRTQFHGELRRMQTSEYVSQWEYFQPLTFLCAVPRERKPSLPLQHCHNHLEVQIKTEDDDLDDDLTPPEYDDQLSPAPFGTSQRINLKRPSSSTESGIMSDAAREEKTPRHGLPPIVATETQIFFDHVLAELTSIRSRRLQLSIKSRIVSEITAVAEQEATALERREEGLQPAEELAAWRPRASQHQAFVSYLGSEFQQLQTVQFRKRLRRAIQRALIDMIVEDQRAAAPVSEEEGGMVDGPEHEVFLKYVGEEIRTIRSNRRRKSVNLAIQRILLDAAEADDLEAAHIEIEN